ncbi:hypothetical protein [Methanococcus voltae]|uniref:Tetratricopeptide (TPR) repeat protein n=2 Tax=Methanococcus voltae TaxID=2188 RepID=A0A8J7USX9_METVO|nr:hypothetical protein [Methanococcus voltae]MBP2171977.1 tetratricopeptide (TPR) repeat protein [Methanococcus voltae]MBP2201068.1 tetratricopeptide (TPR) repeat protein [Methanococcus voltae]MCS3921791.1 tetratricopeptide (TPR) repeat protein [Methanococcus voltae PS]
MEDTVVNWFEEGILNCNSNKPDYEKALICFKRVISSRKMAESEYEIWNLMSSIYHELGKDKLAMQCIKNALDLAPENSKLWIQKAQLLQDDDPEEAKNCFKKALELSEVLEI